MNARATWVILLMGLSTCSARADHQSGGEPDHAHSSSTHVDQTSVYQLTNWNSPAPCGCGEDIPRFRFKRIKQLWRRTQPTVLPMEQPIHTPYRTLEWSYYFRPYHPRDYRRLESSATSQGQGKLAYSNALFENIYREHEAKRLTR